MARLTVYLQGRLLKLRGVFADVFRTTVKAHLHRILTE